MPPTVAGDATVVAVSATRAHKFSKSNQLSVRVIAGLGVEGDAHCGATVKHRSRVAQDPSQPNLRQVHLIHSELFDELKLQGFEVSPGDLGENITTRGIDLLALPVGTHLTFGSGATIRLTGLRNPCAQIDRFRKGLTAAVLGRDASGQLIRKAGVMSVVVKSGEIFPGDRIHIELPAHPHVRLQPV